MLFYQALLVVLTKDTLKKLRIENKKGGILSIVRHGLDFNIQTVTATSAVSGTNFYVYSHEDSAYLCSCNGSVEYSYQGKFILNEAAHHVALECSKEKGLAPDKMRLHNDIEISDLIYRIGQSEKSVK